MNTVFLEIRLYTFDANSDMPLEHPRGLIEGQRVEFLNMANAAATAERLRGMLVDVVDSGLPKLTERFAPGPKTRRKTTRKAGLHALETSPQRKSAKKPARKKR